MKFLNTASFITPAAEVTVVYFIIFGTVGITCKTFTVKRDREANMNVKNR